MLKALLGALSAVDQERSTSYSDIVFAALPEAARQHLEAPGRRSDAPDDLRARIAECTDLEQLDTWIRRAATARSIEDLLG